jgi:hypothetical protein
MKSRGLVGAGLALTLVACVGTSELHGDANKLAQEIASSECFPRNFGGFEHLMTTPEGRRLFVEQPPAGVAKSQARVFSISVEQVHGIWSRSMAGVLSIREMRVLAKHCNSENRTLSVALKKERLHSIEAQSVSDAMREDGFPFFPIGKDGRVLEMTEEEKNALLKFREDQESQAALPALGRSEITLRIRAEIQVVNDQIRRAKAMSILASPPQLKFGLVSRDQ